MRIIGVNMRGEFGAITVLDCINGHNKILDIFDIPFKKGIIDIRQFIDRLNLLVNHDENENLCILSKSGYPQAKLKDFEYSFFGGVSYGIALSIISVICRDPELVSTKMWRSFYPKGFNTIRLSVKLFPDAKKYLGIKNNYNRANSLLIANTLINKL